MIQFVQRRADPLVMIVSTPDLGVDNIRATKVRFLSIMC